MFKDGRKLFYNSELTRNQTFEEFLKPFKNNEMKEFTQTMRFVYDLIVNDFEKILLQKNEEISIIQKIEKEEEEEEGAFVCPSSECFEEVVIDSKIQHVSNKESSSKIRVLKVLTIFFGSASFILISVYIFFYILIENRLVKTYKKL